MKLRTLILSDGTRVTVERLDTGLGPGAFRFDYQENPGGVYHTKRLTARDLELLLHALDTAAWGRHVP